MLNSRPKQFLDQKRFSTLYPGFAYRTLRSNLQFHTQGSKYIVVLNSNFWKHKYFSWKSFRYLPRRLFLLKMLSKPTMKNCLVKLCYSKNGPFWRRKYNMYFHFFLRNPLGHFFIRLLFISIFGTWTCSCDKHKNMFILFQYSG